MARVLTDIVRPEIRRAARQAKRARPDRKPFAVAVNRAGAADPSSVTVFYDGGSPSILRAAARYRRILAGGMEDGPPEILWRDLRRFPFALLGWHVGPDDWHGRLYIVDRCAVLRAGMEARRLLRREIRLQRRTVRPLTQLVDAVSSLRGRMCPRAGPRGGRTAF